MKNISNTLWGIVLIALGLILGLNATGLVDINIFFAGWWTLFIIVPCFIGLFSDKDKTGSFIGLLVGVCLLLGCQDIIDFDILFKLIVPVILVIIGFSVIFKDKMSSKVRKEVKKLNKKGSNKEYCATFSGQDLDFSNEDFSGCDMTAVFGGIKCNLSKSNIKKDVVINTLSVFGGITIIVPSDVNVKVVSTSIFGGVEKKERDFDSKNKTIYINATCLFGGVDIK